MNIIGFFKRVIISLQGNKAIIKFGRKAGVTIGENCTFLNNPNWGSEPYLITIGNNVRVTSNVEFITHDGGVHVIRNLASSDSEEKHWDVFGQIVIGDNVFIGVHSIIMPGVIIGNNVIIGAGSIVTHDIPDNSVACGTPAKVIKSIDEYYEKIRNVAIASKGLPAKEKEQYIKKQFNI